MRKFLAFALCLFTTITVMGKSLVVVLNNGTEVYYKLGGEKNPVMTCEKEVLTVNTDQYAFSNFSRFYISNTDAPAVITDVQKRNTKFNGSTFCIYAEGREVNVFRANGTKVNITVTTKDGMTTIDTNSLQRGTYIITIGQSSFKVCKK